MPVDEVRLQVRVRKVFELAADRAERVERALVMAEQASQAGSDFDAGAVLASRARAALDGGAEDGEAVPTAGATTRVVDQLMGKPPTASKPSADMRSSIAPIVRKGTSLRDGMQCRVPGCCRGWPQLHHVHHVVAPGRQDVAGLRVRLPAASARSWRSPERARPAR